MSYLRNLTLCSPTNKNLFFTVSSKAGPRDFRRKTVKNAAKIASRGTQHIRCREPVFWCLYLESENWSTYLYAGVIANTTITLDTEFVNKKYGRNQTRDLRGPYQNWAPTLALLQICQLVYAEVSALIYSTNRVAIHDLRRLRNLAPSSLSSLAAL
ncbi:hypothetical protein F4824DRAFT_502192 [Ustulina deusta]|nr:hypothetical protein F4824DRAFT_502192 [Ustulina deusta]